MLRLLSCWFGFSSDAVSFTLYQLRTVWSWGEKLLCHVSFSLKMKQVASPAGDYHGQSTWAKKWESEWDRERQGTRCTHAERKPLAGRTVLEWISETAYAGLLCLAGRSESKTREWNGPPETRACCWFCRIIHHYKAECLLAWFCCATHKSNGVHRGWRAHSVTLFYSKPSLE